MATQLCNLHSDFDEFCYSIYDPIKDDIYILGSKINSGDHLNLYLKKYNKTTGLNSITDPLIIAERTPNFINSGENIFTWTCFELCDIKVLGNYVYLFFGGNFKPTRNTPDPSKNYLQIIQINTLDMSQTVYYEKQFDIPTNRVQNSIIGCLNIDTTYNVLLGIYKFTENQLYYVDFQNTDSNSEYIETLISSDLRLNADNKCISSVKLIGNYIYYFVLGLELRKVNITDGSIHYVFTPDNSNLYNTFISHKIYEFSAPLLTNCFILIAPFLPSWV